MNLSTQAATSSSRLGGPLRFIALAAATLIILTSSFDIFLVAQIGPNVRFCQLLAPVLILLAALRAARGARLPLIGAIPLFAWLLFQVAFVPITGFWPKSLGYCLWLLLNIASVYSFVYLFGDDERALVTIIRWYARSFAAIAICGIVQFCLPLFGLPSPLVTEWWIPGRLARVNGFSYEPSYFATYLLIGFVFAGSLRRARTTLISSASLLIIYWLALIGIVLSSSRMGIVFVIAEIFLAQFAPWLLFLKDFGRLRIVWRHARALAPSFAVIVLLSVAIVGAAKELRDNPATMLMLLNGTGISNTAAHSVVERESSFEDTLAVFAGHPVIGRSLGGVSYAIGQLHGEDLHSFEESKQFEGMNIFAEVLAASGIVGVIPFILFLTALIRKPLKLAKSAALNYSALLRALVRSFWFLLAILQFNQNILRPYLWIHIAILAAVYAAAERHRSLHKRFSDSSLA
jgi:hypothetical protein